MIRIGIVGCGTVAGEHLDSLASLPEAKVVGLCDACLPRAQALAKKRGGTAFANIEEMMDTAKPDAVFFFLPPFAHGEPELAAINRRIPFFVEKPVALRMDTALRIRDLADAAGLTTGVGFQCRYSQPSLKAQAFAQESRILYAHCARIGGIPSTPWWADRSRSGGQLVEQAIHQLDLARFVLGEPTWVCARAAQNVADDMPGRDIDDVSVSLIQFAGGTVMTMAAGCYARTHAAYDGAMIFSAADARAELKPLESLRIVRAPLGAPPRLTPSGTAQEGSKEETLVAAAGDARAACDGAFLAAVAGRADAPPPLTDYADACESLRLALALEKSIATGQEVRLTT